MTAQPLLDVNDLTVEFATRRGIVKAVQHVNISVAKGETLGIVGESGSGKSVTSYAVMRILDRAGKIAEGSVTFSGVDVKGATEDQMRDLRGREMSMIFQSPRLALNPIRKIGRQIEDVLLQHAQVDRSQVIDRAIEALEQVKIARPRERYHAYPFELSGGMCQRVVIALALACNPQLLIADEPTTGLDVTTQKAVMDLIVELTRRRGMSTILITHDLGLAAAYCDRVIVMEKGRVVETARSADIFANPQHAYTKKLMRATPRLGVSLRDLLPEEEAPAAPPGTSAVLAGPRPVIHPSSNGPSTEVMDPRVTPGGDKSAKPLLLVEKLVKEYPRQGAAAGLSKLFSRKPPVVAEQFRAVDGISFSVGCGESVGLVGDDGDAAVGPDLGPYHVRRRRDRRRPAECLCAVAAAQEHPDGVPGSDRQPQSALHRRARYRRSDPAARRYQGARRVARALRGIGRPGRAADQSARSLSASIVGRAEGPRRHRPRHRAASQARHSRRADRSTRRLGAGGGFEPAAGPQGVDGHELFVRVT